MTGLSVAGGTTLYHAARSGPVSEADVAIEVNGSYRRMVNFNVRKFLVVIEKGESSYGAYSPDLPGCVAVGATKEEAEQKINDAITFHLEGLREEGLPIPEGESVAEYIVVPENSWPAGSDGARGGCRAESQE